MFAAMTFERTPFTYTDLPAGFMYWMQVVGALSLLGIILWALLGLPFMSRADRERIPTWQSRFFLLCIALAVASYAIFAAVAVATYRSTTPADAAAGMSSMQSWRNIFLTAAGFFALLAACLPILRNLLDLRPRRIWAIARLSFKEAVRNRALYAASILLLFFLFYDWFRPHKPEDQLRGYVQDSFGWMTLFLLLIAAIVASFSIPRDIRQQTIHTIVTKPVERFEIVLGRFLGFMMLMTLLLLVMSTLSLLYVVRGVDPDAAAETLKAREPIYGDLAFEGTTRADRGESVGREWDYRSYIAGFIPGQPTQTAIWSFNDLPSKLGQRPTVRCEYTFDIYRTTKGEEGVGVRCSLAFVSWRFQKGSEEQYREERRTERAKTTDRLSDVEIDNKLAEKYGYYEIPSTNITDYHTMSAQVPGKLFAHAAQSDPDLKKELQRRNQSLAPLQVRVKCNSTTQYLGMAKYDFYFRGDNPDSGQDRLWFAWNFYKAAVGLWLRLGLVTGLATVFSTYLSGVISLLSTGLLYVFGLMIGFIQEVGARKNVGGGPTEAALRLVRREALAAPLEENSLNRMATMWDDYFSMFVRGMVNVIPDVDRSDLVSFVAEGFNIGPGQLLLTCLLMIGYLLPWFLLGYYLIKWREIASAA
jgi:ABC-type transport system involved in multi-copper enzyme maturation permease subunit